MRVELSRHDRGMSEMGSGETGGMNGLGGWTGRMDWAALLLIITGECYYSFF